LVTIPPKKINTGNIQGTLKKRKVNIIATSIITCVIKFVTEILNEVKAANAKNPIAISGINLKICDSALKELAEYTKKDNAHIIIEAGNIQIRRVTTAKGTPPLLYPIKVIVCVEEAPGNIWQKDI